MQLSLLWAPKIIVYTLFTNKMYAYVQHEGVFRPYIEGGFSLQVQYPAVSSLQHGLLPGMAGEEEHLPLFRHLQKAVKGQSGPAVVEGVQHVVQQDGLL